MRLDGVFLVAHFETHHLRYAKLLSRSTLIQLNISKRLNVFISAANETLYISESLIILDFR